MAFAPLPPELRQKALSIASSYKNGGSVASKPIAKFAPGGEVDDDYGTFGADELSNDDPMGMADAVAEAIEKGNTGTTAAEVSAAIDAFSDLDRGEGGGSLEERNRAIQSLLDQAERDSAPPPDTGDTETGRFGGPKPTVENLPAAIEEAKKAGAVSLAAMMQNKLNELQAAQTTVAPKEEKSVTEQALQVDEFGPLFDTPATRPTVPAGGIADLGPVSPDELDEAEDIRGRQAALVEDLDTADDLGPFGEEEMLSGFRELQGKKAGLAGLGVLAGSPMLAAAPVARDIFKTLTQPDVKAGELLAGKGLGRDQTAQEVVNEKGERVGVVVSDPDGVVSIQPTSFKNSFDPALRDAYNKMNERESREREGRGDDREPITEEDVAVEEVEAAPEKPPTIDIIPFRPEDFYYLTQQQRQGLPSMMNMRRS